MPFLKVVKSRPYYMRLQTKYRRRRDGQTDYRARKALTVQAKNKYNSPRYRLVVRFTNREVICQIVYAKVQGDVTMASAYSRELIRYGMPVGLNNYAAAYATGLLCARRLLRKLGLDKYYKGQEQANGEHFDVMEVPDAPRPFTALLDVGLRRTTTGAKVFAAMKGAVDGGVNIPHSDSRFPGYKDDKFDPKTLRKYIYGGHVSNYMAEMQKEDPAKYAKKFSRYVKAGLKPADLEANYKKLHAAIRAKPERPAKPPTPAPRFAVVPRPKRLNAAQRAERVKAKLAKYAAIKV